MPRLSSFRPLHRQRYVGALFGILILSLLIDVSRRNAIDWVAVIPCEMLGFYKPRPEAYRRCNIRWGAA